MVRDLGGGWAEVRLASQIFWLRTAFPVRGAQPLWCACVEKACALALGGWSRLNGGTIPQACRLLFADFEVRSVAAPLVCVVPLPSGYHAARPVETWVVVKKA